MAAKKTTYTEVNTPSTYQIQNSFFWTFVSYKVTSHPKIISRTENAQKVGPTPFMISLDQKWNIKKLGKMLLSKPSGIQRIKASHKRGKFRYVYKNVNITFLLYFQILSKFQESSFAKVNMKAIWWICVLHKSSRTIFWILFHFCFNVQKLFDNFTFI